MASQSEAQSTLSVTAATISSEIWDLPAPPGNIGGEGNASFAWLEASQYWLNTYILPDAPSLRLSEDDFFFQLIRGNNGVDNNRDEDGDEKPASNIRFFHTVPKLRSIRALGEEDADAFVHGLANKPVPTRIRKMEIELVQRQLPRYPSQTHRRKASFYPLAQSTLQSTSSGEGTSFREAKFLAFYRSRLQARKERIAARREKRRLQKERRDRRRAAKDALRKAKKSAPKIRGKKETYQDGSADKRDVPFVVMTGLAAPPSSSEEMKAQSPLETSQSSFESGIPKSNESSMLSSVVSLSDDELLEQSLGDDEYFNEELDYFYSGDKQKLQQVHSRNIEDAEREQRERRLEAEHKARLHLEKAILKQQVDAEEARAQYSAYEMEELARKRESHRIRMAIFLANKWAEEDIPTEDLELGWDVDAQYDFLRSFFSDLAALKEGLFSGDSESEENAKEINEKDAVDTLSENLSTSVASVQPLEIETVIGEHYEPQVGVVSPSLQALILQAQVEMRSRKVPEEHKQKFVPVTLEASEVGRFTRLNEHVVEAYGTKRKELKPKLPSELWMHGRESVKLPTVEDATASNTFTILNEAAALGKIKALKPQIVTNYDILGDLERNEEVDIDDENRHKAMRTNYLTDVYVQGHLRHKKEDLWEDADLEEDTIRYTSLDEVKLPTEQCPVIKPPVRKLSGREIRDEIAQAVAEKAWERRYRLERPHAEQKIKRTCKCKFCKTANPFQTHAYRKRWLVQQGLWTEQEEVEALDAPILEIRNDESMKDEAATPEDEEAETNNSLTIDTVHLTTDPLNLDMMAEKAFSVAESNQTELEDISQGDTVKEGSDLQEPTNQDHSNMQVDNIDRGDVAAEEDSDLAGPVGQDYSKNGVDNIVQSNVASEGACDPDKNVHQEPHGDDLTRDNGTDSEGVSAQDEAKINDEGVENGVTEVPLQDESPEHPETDEAKSDTDLVRSDAESEWSTDDDEALDDEDAPRKPRRKRSFWSEVGSVLGLARVDDNDNSARAKAQRLRQQKRRSRQLRR